MACACFQGFVEIQGDQIKNEFFQGGVFGPQQRHAAAGTFRAVQPDHRRPLRVGDGVGNTGSHACRQGHTSGEGGTELHKITAANSACPCRGQMYILTHYILLGLKGTMQMAEQKTA